MSKSILEINALNLSFSGQAHPFFSELHMPLKQGKLHNLKGRNGSGKSTLFGALRGSLDGQAVVTGSLSVGNQTFSLSPRSGFKQVLQSRVALVSQKYDTMIADQFSFAENLSFASFSRFPCLYRATGNVPSIPDFVGRFGIAYDSPARLLSGGQRQILALLMVLQSNPALLLLDEPTAALDAVNARMVFEFICELVAVKGTTALVVCHDLELANEYCKGSAFELVIDPLTKIRHLA